MLTSNRFQEDDCILSLSTQGGTTLQEDNVSFTQYPELLPTNVDMLNFSTQIFDDFFDQELLHQFDDGGGLEFDDGLDKIFNSRCLILSLKRSI